jgi:prostaglandin-endoperoxide synthase 2
VRGFGDIKLRLANWLETYVTTHFPGLWQRVMKYPEVHRLVNALLIDRAILKIPTRPNPLRTLADYTSWASLTNRLGTAATSRRLRPAIFPTPRPWQGC